MSCSHTAIDKESLSLPTFSSAVLPPKESLQQQVIVHNTLIKQAHAGTHRYSNRERSWQHLGGKKFLDHVKLASRHHAGLPIPSKHKHAFCKDASEMPSEKKY